MLNIKGIKKRRIDKGLTQNDLANITKIAKRNIVAYETGQAKPPIDKLCKLADALGVTTDYLLGRE